MAVFLDTFLPDTDPSSKSQAVAEGLEQKEGVPYRLIKETDIMGLIKERKSFSHKGTYGHALIIAGAVKTMGAALLSSKACLYGGAGLTTAVIPENGLSALNATLPEVMYLERKELEQLRTLEKYNAVAVGPGIGKTTDSFELLRSLIALKEPLIIDADALGLLGDHQNLLSRLTKGTVLTPHMKEFDTLFGKHENWWARLQTAREQAKELEIVIILKNQYTFIIDELGEVMINPTGNPAMAQGGMGDVLTGLVAAYVAQGYSPRISAILACYLHGKAGDELAKNAFNVTASQVALRIPETVKGLLSFKL